MTSEMMIFSGVFTTLGGVLIWAVRFIAYKFFGPEGNGGGAWGKLLDRIDLMRGDIQKNTEALTKLEAKIKNTCRCK